jgi:uncharacterized protein YbaP (TraB family)
MSSISVRSLGIHLVVACAALVSLLSQAQADPGLWIVKSRSATVYLFGTVHVLPRTVTWMDPKIQAALAESSELWTEADIGDLSEGIDAIRHYGMGDAGETEHLLPPEYRARYASQIAKTGLSATFLARARPWLADMLLTTSAIQRAGGGDSGVDVVLLAYAHDHKLATPTFETMEQQFAMMSDLPRDSQIASLENAIDEFDHAGPIYGQMLAAWQSGDQAKLDTLVNLQLKAKNELLWTELILRRNEKFADRIGDRLQGSGTAFVAVGAGHLCGSDGMPALLMRRGFEVTRVE